MSFHNSTRVKKTRRARRCDWCGELIQRGDPSVTCCGSDGGDFYNSRYHPECFSAIKRYCTKHRSWGEELPDEHMNRGGIEPNGEPEDQPLDTP